MHSIHRVYILASFLILRKTFNILASMLLVVKVFWVAVLRLKFMLQMSMVAHVWDPNIYAAEKGRFSCLCGSLRYMKDQSKQ